jgi:hypothetical protein
VKLAKDTVQKLVLLREELRFLQQEAGFLGDSDILLANADWSGTITVLRPNVILHTIGVSGNSYSGLKQGSWFTIVAIPKSYKLSIPTLDALISQQQGEDGSVVDALATLAQAAAPLPDHQRNQVTKALGVVRRTMRAKA